ncbi:hypothetical protein ACMGGS_15690 [Superficieibacter sp. BNK-5]|uniref:hypothetical protein n=1 Tax=Superficieibacter sp. BNK-5 TaxID=3376142 RepID=UPI0039BF8F3B
MSKEHFLPVADQKIISSACRPCRLSPVLAAWSFIPLEHVLVMAEKLGRQVIPTLAKRKS